MRRNDKRFSEMKRFLAVALFAVVVAGCSRQEDKDAQPKYVFAPVVAVSSLITGRKFSV